MFHSSVLPVGLPVGLVLGAIAIFAMKALGISPVEVAASAKLIGGLANVVAGGAKNLAMLDIPSLLTVRWLSLLLTVVLIGSMAAG